MSIILKIRDLFRRYNITKQAATFIVVGGFSTIISYSTFILCLHQLDLHYLIANIVGFFVSIGFSYQCNKRWTFKVQDTGYFCHYFLLYSISLTLSSLLLHLFVESCGIIPEVANILTIALITGFNFCGAKFFVFRRC